MTSEAIELDDLAANLKDRMWRLNNLYYITDKDGKRVKFKPNLAQSEFLQGWTGRDIILKARQLGFTTLMCIVGLDEAVFNGNWNVAIIAHNLDDAKVIFESKVKFPYDNLPEVIRERTPARNDQAGLLRFAHNSTIRVATSARSGTLQRLHVSEFGKICAKYPQKAREIVTGAFPATGKNPITIESTAEGQEGYFYQYCMEAMRGDGEFKFHFFPWHNDPSYTAPIVAARITPDLRHYFDKLEYEHKIKLTPEQKAWWAKEEMLLGGDMKRENPATAEEAFEQAIEGAYFSTQLAHADKRGFIRPVPHDPMYPVNTFWDLGRNDNNVIWLHQFIDGRHKFIGYYENSGEHLSHYVAWLEDWRKSNDARWGEHYWPHDGKREDLFLENGRLGEAEKYGLRPNIVPRATNKQEAIESARRVLAYCDFDESECATGVKRLRHYRKEWDDQREVFKDRPRHDINSHGADGFMTFATGYQATDPFEDEWEEDDQEYGRNSTTGY